MIGLDIVVFSLLGNTKILRIAIKLLLVSFAFTVCYTSYYRTTCLLTPLVRVGLAGRDGSKN